MKKVLSELNLSLDEFIVIAAERCDVVISDITLIDDEIINEVYTTVYTEKISYAELLK